MLMSWWCGGVAGFRGGQRGGNTLREARNQRFQNRNRLLKAVELHR